MVLSEKINVIANIQDRITNVNKTLHFVFIKDFTTPGES